jgi:general stress protein YciG
MVEKGRRGFAGMDREKQRQIASKGGKAAHQKGTAHEFTPEEARVAGRKGGQVAHARGRAHQFTPEEAREAGRKGGLASRGQGQPESAPEAATATQEMSELPEMPERHTEDLGNGQEPEAMP